MNSTLRQFKKALDDYKDKLAAEGEATELANIEKMTSNKLWAVSVQD